MRLRWWLVLVGGIGYSFRTKSRIRSPSLLYSHPFLENSKDGDFLRQVSEVRSKLSLDGLSVSELRSQIKSRGGLSQGIYEKDELVRHLAYLIGNWMR